VVMLLYACEILHWVAAAQCCVQRHCTLMQHCLQPLSLQGAGSVCSIKRVNCC
jgi:hypothetical protein